MTEQKEPVPGLRFREALCTTQNTSRAAGRPELGDSLRWVAGRECLGATATICAFPIGSAQ